MNATDTDEITAYVEAVSTALAGLPEEVREGLLEDLPEHLAEVVADDIGTLAERLGPPAVYAAELLASAGYVGGGFPDPPPAPRRLGPLRRARASLGSRLRELDTSSGPLFGKPRASDFLIQLRPAWWVLRGYLFAMVLASALGDGSQIGLLPRVGGSDLVALGLLGACVVVSIWFGRRRFTMKRPVRLVHTVATGVLVLIGLVGFADIDQTNRYDPYMNAGYSDPYGNVRDVFVYDREGNLVEGARLLDQDGQPIRLGSPNCVDEQGNYVENVQENVYPYCAKNAPFRMTGKAPVPTPSR
ncbi:HAAS signaling domain-containing protein [Actinoplanes sp. NPDC049265]|uniref:HAAS signaling domain-containing protein n=1 Tax=Actinoplanes sp. NPDC049265 TaxID=3363902 RepID=UPI00371A927A